MENYPLTKTVCQLNQELVFTHLVSAHLSPLEADEGVYLMPANTVDIKPPEKKEGYIARYNAELETWDYLEDNKGKLIFNTKDASSMECKDYGPIPYGYTTIEPPNQVDYYWDGGKWLLKETKLSEWLAEQKEKLFNLLYNKTDFMEKQLFSRYSSAEVKSFYKQEENAKAYNGTEESAPLLAEISRGRGVPLDILVQKVKAKSVIGERLLGIILGQSQKLEDKIKIITEEHQVQEITNELNSWNPLIECNRVLSEDYQLTWDWITPKLDL